MPASAEFGREVVACRTSRALAESQNLVAAAPNQRRLT